MIYAVLDNGGRPTDFHDRSYIIINGLPGHFANEITVLTFIIKVMYVGR